MKFNKFIVGIIVCSTPLMAYSCNKYLKIKNENISLNQEKKDKTISKEELDKGLSNYVANKSPLYVKDILIVNKEYSVPNNLANGLNEDVLKQFESMKLDALKDGLELNIRSGFRSNEYQTELYNTYVEVDGEEKASTYSAKPGHSEHETGLAIDITSEITDRSIGDWFTETPQAKWLYENAWKYGFILRYPKGKESITGYKYESWHYRYVGTEHSKNFNQNNLTLEEYVGLVN